MAVKVGTFTKSVAAAPATQAITGTGFPVKALILWGTNATLDNTWQDGLRSFIGFATATENYCQTASTEHGANPYNSANLMASAAISYITPDGVLEAEADAGMDDDGFTLTWTTNDANAYLIHYMALGGDDLKAAKIVTSETAGDAANHAIVGVGFRPDVVLHINGLCADVDTPLDGSSCCIGLGAMDSAGNQWSWSTTNRDATDYVGGLNTAANCIALYRPSAIPGLWYNAQYVSMDANGFTVFWVASARPQGWECAHLCLKCDAIVGHTHQPAAPGTVAVAGFGFMPEGALITDGYNPEGGTSAGASVGAYDGTDQLCATFNDSGAPNDAQVIDSTASWLRRATAAGAFVAEAHADSLDAEGFTIHWTDSDNVSRFADYVAFRGGSYTVPPYTTVAHRPPLTYSLTLKPSVVSTAGSVIPSDITDLARNWTRSTRLQGGFWTGSFTVPGGKRAFDAFDTWLGSHIEERSGGQVTWEGMVYEMELSTNGFVYRISLDPMYNKIRANYTDALGVDQQTTWVTNAASIARFGTKEMILDVDTESVDVANDARDKYLAEYGWPWPRIIGVCPMTQDELRVTTNGYVFTLNWKYLSGAGVFPIQDTPAEDFKSFGGPTGYTVPGSIAGSTVWYDTGGGADFTPYSTPLTEYARCSIWTTGNLATDTSYAYLGPLDAGLGTGINNIYCFNDQDLTLPLPANYGYNGSYTFAPTSNFVRQGADVWVRLVVDTDSEFLTSGAIDDNRIQVQRDISNRGDTSTLRGWEAIQKVIEMGDLAQMPWRAWVGVGRVLNYGAIGTTPSLYVLDGNWRTDPAASPMNPWQLKPGVGKVLNYRYAPERTGYWLPDPATFLLEEVNVNSAGAIQPSMAEISQTENMLTYLAALAAGTGGGAGHKERSIPPNWNVEANRPNELGPGGDRHGYWTVENGQYVWVHDNSINLSSWWDPVSGSVEYVT